LALAAEPVPEKPFPPAKDAAKETPAEKPKAPAVPIVINADEIESRGNDFTFIGNVSVVRGDVTLTCERMNASMEEVETVDPETKKKTVRKQITSLVAVGHVEVIEKSTKRRAGAHRAEYDRKKETIVMTGTKDQRPRIWDGEKATEADMITYMLKQRKFHCKGDTKFILPENALAPDSPKKTEKKKPE